MTQTGTQMGATTFVLPELIVWLTPPGAPAQSYESAFLQGDPAVPGPYFALMRWHPGFMSAPHTYTSDRMAYVLSGLWWIGDGPDYDPASCRPVPAGSYVFRPAGTPHFDGVMSGAAEPAIIAVAGVAPLNLRFTAPGEPGLRRADSSPQQNK